MSSVDPGGYQTPREIKRRGCICSYCGWGYLHRKLKLPSQKLRNKKLGSTRVKYAHSALIRFSGSLLSHIHMLLSHIFEILILLLSCPFIFKSSYSWISHLASLPVCFSNQGFLPPFPTSPFFWHRHFSKDPRAMAGACLALTEHLPNEGFSRILNWKTFLFWELFSLSKKQHAWKILLCPSVWIHRHFLMK